METEEKRVNVLFEYLGFLRSNSIINPYMNNVLFLMTVHRVTMQAPESHYIPTEQPKAAGFGLHPVPVHTALILPSGTRPGSQL